MRNELEKIELIEKYLLNQLTAEELENFEKELEASAELRTEVENQKNLVEGVKKIAFKQQAKMSHKKFNIQQKLWKWGLAGGLSIIALAVLIPLSVNTNKLKTNVDVPPILTDVSNQTNFDALENQNFSINPNRDTVIETKGGIVLAIPANAFSGNESMENVDFIVKEALTPEQIVLSGLSTMSNGKLLETGGMFYIDAFSKGKKLTLQKEIYTEVPTNEIKNGMQLFDGEQMADGQINWVNPKPLENWLTPVDILSLDFYPPGYLEKLKELGYEGKSKEWKDSVYYSFSGNTSKYNYSEDGSYLSSYETSHQINPSRIKAIWDKKFNNTNLATKEFEQRLKIIFSTCNPKALELYIKNLDKNLWEVDSMVAKIVDAEQKAKFIAFKNQRVGRVKVDDKLAMNLATYYDNKQKKYKNELEEIQLKYEREQQKLDTEFNRAQQKQSDTEFKRKSENIKKEFTKNLNEVHQQLGIKPIKYSVAIVALGFKNVDRYVDDVYLPTLNSTNQRASTTINYNGKTAQTTYTPFMVEIPNRQQFDKVFSYLLCDELYSFQRMKDTTNGFHENLNGFLKYNLAIVAYKGDSLYFFSKSNLNPVDGKLVANLQASTKNQIAAQLELMSKKSYKSDVLEDLDFHSLKVKNDKRKLKNQEI